MRGRTNFVGYLVAIVATANVVGLRYFIFDAEAPISLLIASVLAASWVGGLWPGVLATVLGAIAGANFFMAGSDALFDPYNQQRLLFFSLTGLAIAGTAEFFQVFKRRTAIKTRQLEEELRALE